MKKKTTTKEIHFKGYNLNAVRFAIQNKINFIQALILLISKNCGFSCKGDFKLKKILKNLHFYPLLANFWENFSQNVVLATQQVFLIKYTVFD